MISWGFMGEKEEICKILWFPFSMIRERTKNDVDLWYGLWAISFIFKDLKYLFENYFKKLF